MKLMAKFNLILLVLFGAGGVIISQLAYHFLSQNARREVLRQAELLMASAEAVRDYTSGNLEPVLTGNPDSKNTFHAEMVPSSVAKMNDALVPFASMNAVVLLFTCPLGDELAGPFAPGLLDFFP